MSGDLYDAVYKHGRVGEDHGGRRLPREARDGSGEVAGSTRDRMLDVDRCLVMVKS